MSMVIRPAAACCEDGAGESKTASSLAELGAESFFSVVAGEEDLAVTVEAVNQTFDGGGGVPHWA